MTPSLPEPHDSFEVQDTQKVKKKMVENKKIQLYLDTDTNTDNIDHGVTAQKTVIMF